MNEDKNKTKDLEETIIIVEGFLKSLARYYDVLGFDGLTQLVDPSLDDLLKVINEFEKTADEFFKDSEHGDKTNFIEVNKIINLKQGLLFARGLVISAIERNPESCDRYRNDMAE